MIPISNTNDSNDNTNTQFNGQESSNTWGLPEPSIEDKNK
jgi:hypothetical protein